MCCNTTKKFARYTFVHSFVTLPRKLSLLDETLAHVCLVAIFPSSRGPLERERRTLFVMPYGPRPSSSLDITLHSEEKSDWSDGESETEM